MLGLVAVLLGPRRPLASAAGACTAAGHGECSASGERLAPSDLPLPRLFDGFEGNASVPVNGTALAVRRGSILQQGDTRGGTRSQLVALPGLVPRPVVAEILTLLRGDEDADRAGGATTIALDRDPDSVDGMTSQEIFLDNDNLRDGRTSKGFAEEGGARAALRARLRALTDPCARVVLAPFLEAWYGPGQCWRDGRRCRPCYSLIRRYRAGERQSHAPHHDAHAFVTVVVSLSDYGREYAGGLYVAARNSERHYVRLDRGDAVAHQGDLHHGVRVLDRRDDGGPSERWSWILWFRDSDTCADHSAGWHRRCAEAGNPTCMYLHATRQATPDGSLAWNRRASDAGHAQAAVKLAYAHLKALPSRLAFDADAARRLFAAAVQSSGEPDGHYGLAALYLAQAQLGVLGQPSNEGKNRAALAARGSAPVRKAVAHLEDAARGGHTFAMFNLGVCHAYGYGAADGVRDGALAAQWFEASGLPEGLFAKALYLAAVGRPEDAEEYRRKAAVLGFGAPWRKEARERTGNGGSAGPKLNLKWPHLPGGEVPPEW